MASVSSKHAGSRSCERHVLGDGRLKLGTRPVSLTKRGACGFGMTRARGGGGCKKQLCLFEVIMVEYRRAGPTKASRWELSFVEIVDEVI